MKHVITRNVLIKIRFTVTSLKTDKYISKNALENIYTKNCSWKLVEKVLVMEVITGSKNVKQNIVNVESIRTFALVNNVFACSNIL
jgi:hypothetical protein